MNYYSLIAGLPEIEIGDNKLPFSVLDFKDELDIYLSEEDARLTAMFFAKFDNQNFLRFLKDKDAKFDKRGNITRQDLIDGLEISDGDKSIVPSYFNAFMEEYKNSQNTDTEPAVWENRLTELYYQWAMQCKNKFIARWFEYNLNLNNILTASANRKHHKEVEVVGENEVAEIIKKSSQRDFGLTGTIDELETYLRIAEEPDLLEREKKIDLLQWEWLNEQTAFEYFSIDQIFAYLVKLEIVERWSGLDHEEGGKTFRNLISKLKDDVVNRQKSEHI